VRPFSAGVLGSAPGVCVLGVSVPSPGVRLRGAGERAWRVRGGLVGASFCVWARSVALRFAAFCCVLSWVRGVWLPVRGPLAGVRGVLLRSRRWSKIERRWSKIEHRAKWRGAFEDVRE